MHSSHKILIAMTGGVVVMSLLAFVVLAGMSASFAWTEGGGYGSGPDICQTATPGMGSPTPGAPGATPTLRAPSARRSWPGRGRWPTHST